MVDDLSNRRRAPGEKPVINEEFQPYVVDKFVKRYESVPSKKTEKKPSPVAKGAREGVTNEISRSSLSDTQAFRVGVRLFNMKRWENALRELLLVNDNGFSGEEQDELAYYLGLCYTKLEQYEDALPHLEQVVAGGDLLRVYQCRLTLAYIYVTTGRAKLAEFELEHLQKSGLESASLYNTLAYAAYIQKQYGKAIELYEKALKIDKNNATALNSMGYILADTGMDIMRGLQFCRKAFEQKPQNASYLDSLGWAYYKCGNLPEAHSLLRKAIGLAPKEKEIQEHYRVITGGSP